jgi:hypothetical protein
MLIKIVIKPITIIIATIPKVMDAIYTGIDAITTCKEEISIIIALIT